MCVCEYPWRACVRTDKLVIFLIILFFFVIRNVHIVEIREIIENLGFIYLLVLATAGRLLMLCLGFYGL